MRPLVEVLMFLGLSGGQPVYIFDRPARLLVVDDDPIMREFALAHLAMPGGTILTAEDGEDAWDILERETEPFDMVLSDLEMPRLTGFGLVDRMRADPRFAHLPIIVITSREDMFAIDRAYETGATSFVTKPVNWRLLGHQMRYVMKASRMEAANRSARQAAEEAVDLRNGLLTLVRHESQDSLHAILGFSELLQAGTEEGVDLHDYATRVRDAARRLNEGLERIFSYAQLATGAVVMDPEIMPASHLVDEVARAMAPEAERAGIRLHAETIDAGSATVTGDLRYLSRALVEVIRNAIHHGGQPTPITLRATRSADGPVTIEVSDEGAGMSEGLLARCQRMPAPSDGDLGRCGLGIPTARRIVELNGGAFAISSTVGEGTSVAITLPVAA